MSRDLPGNAIFEGNAVYHRCFFFDQRMSFYKQILISVYIVMQIIKGQSEIDYTETIKTRQRQVQCENFIHKWCGSV